LLLDPATIQHAENADMDLFGDKLSKELFGEVGYRGQDARISFERSNQVSEMSSLRKPSLSDSINQILVNLRLPIGKTGLTRGDDPVYTAEQRDEINNKIRDVRDSLPRDVSRLISRTYDISVSSYDFERNLKKNLEDNPYLTTFLMYNAARFEREIGGYVSDAVEKSLENIRLSLEMDDNIDQTDVFDRNVYSYIMEGYNDSFPGRSKILELILNADDNAKENLEYPDYLGVSALDRIKKAYAERAFDLPEKLIELYGKDAFKTNNN